MKTALALLFTSLVATGCEKAEGKSSGPLGGDDLSLFRDVPGGNVGLFGGNYMKMQNFMQSTLGQMASGMMEKAGMGEGFGKWLACFSELKDLKVAGGLAIANGFEIRAAFKGMSVDQIDGCAKKAGFTHAVDADKKFVSITIPGPMGMSFTQGYLALPDGAVYNRQRFAMSVMPSSEPITRADLEGDTKALATSNATGDKQLVALAAKVDRSRTFWFAGSGTHTAAADTVGDLYGTFELDGGIRADVTVGFNDTSLAKKVDDGVDELKKMSDQLPPDVRGMLDDLSVKRDGGTVHVKAKISDAQLKSLSKLGGLGI